MLMNKLDPQSDSPHRLIIAAIGLYILVVMPDIVAVAMEAIYRVLSRRVLSGDALYLSMALVQTAEGGIMLSAAFIKGRTLGHGDARVGLGDETISNRPTLALIAVLLGAYVMLTDIAYASWRNKLFILTVSPWLKFYTVFVLVILAPLAEEAFFRGWLWTGLRRHWGVLPTAVLTSAFFLAAHLPKGFFSLVVIVPATVAFAIARQLGKSVRASIALHMMYNLTVLISPLVLKLFALV
jgi:membrane protease YdiL (CAAX protease family)